MPGIFVFFVFVAIIALVGFGAAQSKRTTESWQRAARKMRLSYVHGGVFSSRSITGRMGGLFVTIDTFTKSSGSGNNRSSTTYTRFVVLFPRSLGLGMRLSREGFFTGITKFFGAQDITVGDGGFDSDILVKSRNAARVRKFLTPARRVRIRRLLTTHKSATIDDSGVRYNHVGLIRDPMRLESTLKALVRVAWFLSGNRKEDESFDRVLRARDEGRTEEAFTILRGDEGASSTRRSTGRATRRRKAKRVPRVSMPAVPPPLPTRKTPAELSASKQEKEAASPPAEEMIDIPLVDEALVESELLHLAGRDEEAKAILDEALEEAPLDEEVLEWSKEVAREVVPGSPRAESTSAESPSPETEPVALDVGSVCATLFDKDRNSLETSRLFEESYIGKQVSWSGSLKSSETYPFDFVFGGEEGAKATVEIYEAGENLYGGNKVFAVVKIPRESVEALQSAEGKRVKLAGTLLKVDGFMRNLYLTDGEVTLA